MWHHPSYCYLLALRGCMWKRSGKRLCRAIRCGLVACLAVSIHAESNCNITGRVLDRNSRAIAGAKVLVRNSATLREREATTNNEGIYEILELPVGSYRLQVSARGFHLY